MTKLCPLAAFFFFWVCFPGIAQDTIDAQLAAGRFSNALDIATQLAEGPDRDAFLGRIAVAQAAAGEREAAVCTLRMLSGSRAAGSAVVDSIAHPPIDFGQGGPGGGSQADFESLIDLIKSTVATESWDDVGGPGAADGFVGGVHVDTEGLLKRIVREDSDHLARLRQIKPWIHDAETAVQSAVRQPSELRYVSLPRLEREILFRRLAGKPLDDAMLFLAGLRRVQYVFLYPETGDLVLAGPAGPWNPDGEGRIVDPETGLPVLQLDDLVTLWRRQLRYGPGPFGCSITPTRRNLASVNAFLAESSQRPLKPGQRARDQWLAEIQDRAGRQTIQVDGLDPRTRVARVLVEADYRMKLVGMGLEDGVPGVASYLASIPARRDEDFPAMNVLRWWFTLNYRAITTTRKRNAYAIRGPGVQVLSENELVTQLGDRIHTGQSDELTLQFALSFTNHFKELSAKYPVYADLRNVFDLALVVALIHTEGLAKDVGWRGAVLQDESLYRVRQSVAPKEVESVINYRILSLCCLVAGVSGGVSIDTRPFVTREAIEENFYGSEFHARGVVPENLAPIVWWWD
ncbi:MAG: DUF1598 domain-containing protein [Pirellulales bacterium]|nr:DUF1598 domain-containing protein [Pirellulales bacterium]